MLILLWQSRVLRWHGTSSVAARLFRMCMHVYMFETPSRCAHVPLAIFSDKRCHPAAWGCLPAACAANLWAPHETADPNAETNAWRQQTEERCLVRRERLAAACAADIH